MSVKGYHTLFLAISRKEGPRECRDMGEARNWPGEAFTYVQTEDEIHDWTPRIEDVAAIARQLHVPSTTVTSIIW